MSEFINWITYPQDKGKSTEINTLEPTKHTINQEQVLERISLLEPVVFMDALISSEPKSFQIIKTMLALFAADKPMAVATDLGHIFNSVNMAVINKYVQEFDKSKLRIVQMVKEFENDQARYNVSVLSNYMSVPFDEGVEYLRSCIVPEYNWAETEDERNRLLKNYRREMRTL